MRYKIVTTMGPGGYETYGRRFLESMGRHWPGASLEVYTHDVNQLEHPGATIKRLEDTNGWQKIRAMLPDGKDGPSLAYAFKAIALAESVEPSLDWIGFVDADVEIMQNVTDADIAALLDDNFDLTYLWRKAVRESEGSWIGFNLQTPAGASLLADFYGLYVSGEFAHFRKPHDNAILDRLVAIHRAHGLRVCNLAEGALGLDAFHQSPLARFAVHYKGPNKDVVADPGAMVPGRYELLCNFVRQVVGRVERDSVYLLEVGTWNGSRAVQMANAAFEAGAKSVHYLGFDTFDQGNDRVFEGHTKPHASVEVVRGRLENFARVMARKGLTFCPNLVMGDSTATLPQMCADLMYDFAYIDGGHSYPTAKSDYESLKRIPYIVFDDVLNEEEGAPEGPRRVLEEIADRQVRIIRTGDPYAGLQGDIGFGLVVHPDKPLLEITTTIQVQPKHSVDPTEQIESIRLNSNCERVEWLKTSQAHGKTALLVSAGPSLKESLPAVREAWLGGATIFAVKHAVPTLMAASIYPEYVVLLDPRPPGAKSTHGIERAELIGSIAPTTTALVATITNPETVEMVRRDGSSRLLMWHHVSSTNLGAELPELHQGLVVRGGTCAATCMPALASIMGFRRFKFFGYDFCYPADTQQEGIEQKLIEVRVGQDGRPLKTTGELVAAMQDLQTILPWMIQQNFTVEFCGGGAGPMIWHEMAGDYKAPGEYVEE